MENGPQPLTAEEEEDLRTSSDILMLSPPMTRRLWATLDATRARAELTECVLTTSRQQHRELTERWMEERRCLVEWKARAEEAEAERDAWKVRAEKAEDEVRVLRGLLQML